LLTNSVVEKSETEKRGDVIALVYFIHTVLESLLRRRPIQNIRCLFIVML